MPFTDEAAEIVVRGERVGARANQIIIWVSLTLRSIEEPYPSAIPFPAIVDTGHSHSFAIQQRHLLQWGGLRPEELRLIGAARHRGQRLDLRAANIWAHPNQRGERERLIPRRPHWIEPKSGIAIYPDGDFPRLPILGLKAIADNELILKVDGGRRVATLRTPLKWWWPFG